MTSLRHGASNLLWFIRRWRPITIRVRFNSPHMLWRMATRREAILAAFIKSRQRAEAHERQWLIAQREAQGDT